MFLPNTYRRFILFLVLTSIGVIFTGEAQEDTPLTALPENLQVITAENYDQLELLGTIRNAYVPAVFVTWSPDNRHFVTASTNGHYYIAADDLLNGQTIRYAYNVFSGVDFNRNNPSILTIAGQETIFVFDLEANRIISEITTEHPAGKILFSPDGQYIAAEDNEITMVDAQTHPGEIAIYDVQSAEAIGRVGYRYSSQVLDNPGKIPFDFSMDGTQLLTGRLGLHAWGYTDTSDYRDPNLRSKSDYLEIFTNILIESDNGVTFNWVAFANPDGVYALWLTSPDGETYFSIQNGGYETITPDENGIPGIFDEFTQLDRREVVVAARELSEIPFQTPLGEAYITTRNEASVQTSLYQYDAGVDTLTNQQTAVVYTPTEVFGAGRYENRNGQPPTASGGAPMRFYYEVVEGRLPDVVMDDLFVHEVSVSQDRNYLVVTGTNTDTREYEIRLIDAVGNETLMEVPVNHATNFSFNSRGNLLIVSGVLNPGIGVWDLNTFELIVNETYDDDERLAPQHTFSPDGRILVRHGREIQFWGIPD